jgi:hypothetical protein
VKDAFTELREVGHITMDPKVFSSFRQDIYGLMGLPEYYRIEKETNCLE